MKTFQEFQEQMLSPEQKAEIKISAMKVDHAQRARYANWQRKHAYHELEAKNSREDQDRIRQERETQIK